MNDLISRQAAIDAFFIELCFNKEREYAIGYKGIEKIINGLPPAEKTGRWQYVNYGGFGNYHCTACGKICVCNGNYDFCPNCGARMVE